MEFFIVDVPLNCGMVQTYNNQLLRWRASPLTLAKRYSFNGCGKPT
jgi:hypothetical protein